jgi:signal transduction histidine kinase
LGLWMAQQVVTAMGGTVRLESELHRGSTFIIELPRNP